MTTVEVLKAARARIAKGWCVNSMAATADGRPIPFNHPNAVSWCAVGAIAAESTDLFYEAKYAVCHAVGADHLALSVWNDAPDRTQAEVLAAFDKAIALAEKETA